MGDSEWACYGTETSRNVRGQEETDSTALLSAGEKKKKDTLVGGGDGGGGEGWTCSFTSQYF